METTTSTRVNNNQVPNISIDAALVLIFNNSSELSDKQVTGMASLLDAKVAENPELAEPISAIKEMLGL